MGEKPNLLVPHILIASYLYYVLDQSVISDALFDELCTRLLAEWSTIEHHHKHLITPEDLRAGTGFAFQYPERVVGAALHFRDQFLGQSVRPVARRRSKKKT